MNGHEKSHECVVPAKPGNKTAQAEADSVEGRHSTAGNPNQRNANRAQNRGNAPSGLERVREAARRDKTTRFTTLRSEEHTSELQSPDHLVCRLLLEKKKKINNRKQVK